MDVATWLAELGLDRYEAAFRDNAIDAEILPELTDADLEKLGVLLGHRKRLLKAIADLRAGVAAPAAPTETSVELPPEARRAGEAERRQLTVMFADLVGSTDLSTRLDPEDLGEVMRSYQHRCADVITRWGGHVAKYMGDGVLAYFGWPQAHEDDAERAVRAGLAVGEAIKSLVAPYGTPLAVRIGIATGLVVVGELVGEGDAREEAVVGKTPHLAAHLQALAPPNGVVIAQSTYRLLGGLFDLRELGVERLEGFIEPVRAWQVIAEGAAEGRFEALRGERLTPLVGRAHELALLLERWSWATDGDGQVVLLAGEPGIGKSRLVRAVREQLIGEPCSPISFFCSSYHISSVLYPVIGFLERAAGFEPEDSAEQRLDRLTALLARSMDQLDDAVPLVAALLSIPTGERYPPLAFTPQRQKQRTLEVLADQLVGLAARQPVLAIFEDAQWIDPTTLELLDLVVERVRHVKVLVLITSRPEFHPPWAGQAHVTYLPLNRLGRRQGAAIVERLTGGKPLPDEILEQIVAKTDGVPLFVEELTKAVLESGLLRDAGDRYQLPGALPPLALPATLHDSLMARLDRLAPVKEVAQIAAVIGREFSHELIAAVAHRPQTELLTALDQLTSSELIFRRGTPPEATYSFKHALVQDAAYQSLLRSKRQQLHARIAAALEQGFPDVAESQPELLAQHFTDAGLADRALDYWLAAGERALRASANVEAIKHLAQGIQLLSSLPQTPERDRKELRFQTKLGSGFLTTRGWAAAEAAQAYERAEELCRTLGDSGERFKSIFGLWMMHAARGEMARACAFSDELFRLAEQSNDDDLRLQAHHAAWGGATWLGEFAASRAHVEQGLAIYTPVRHDAHALVYGGHDPGVCGWAQGGLDLWFLGYPDRAAEHMRRAVALAEQIGHAPTLAHALNYGVLCHQLRQDEATVGAWTERMARLAAEQALALQEATAIAARGWMLARQGQAKSSLAELRRGFEGCEKLGVRIFAAYFKAILAEACLAAGDAPAGLDMLEETMQFTQASGVGFWDAELLRLKGNLSRLAGRASEDVEPCYLGALGVARRQQARSLELRAAGDLALLWAERGERHKAHDLLAPAYDWFTEGFDTADLKEAKALLEELA